MASAEQIARKALNRLNVVAAGEEPSSDSLLGAVEALSDMIAAWEAEGLQGDVLPLPKRFEQGVTAMLAIRLAEDFGATPGPVLLRDAERGERQLEAAFLGVPKSVFDASLVNVRHNSAWIGITAPEMWYKDWLANSEIELRATRVKDRNLYECTQAGTTGDTGPSGMDAEIADGTVTWCWRRVVG